MRLLRLCIALFFLSLLSVACDDGTSHEDSPKGPVLFSSGFGDYANSLALYDARLLVLVSGTNQIKDAKTGAVYIDLGPGAQPYEMIVANNDLYITANGETTIYHYKNQTLQNTYKKGKNPSSITLINDALFVTFSGDFALPKHGTIAKLSLDLKLLKETESQCNNPQSVVLKKDTLFVSSAGDLDFVQKPVKPVTDSCIESYTEELNLLQTLHYPPTGLRGNFGKAILYHNALLIGSGTMDGYFSYDEKEITVVENSTEQGMSKVYNLNDELVILYFNRSRVMGKKVLQLPQQSGPIDMVFDPGSHNIYILTTLNSSIYSIQLTELGL